MTVPSGWTVERRTGRADELHRLEDPGDPEPTARILEVASPALVLGSTQAVDVVDRLRADRAGVEVVRRRSGGGAVLLAPGAQVWVDLLVPAGHRLWDDDVGRAAWWAGECWARALSDVADGPFDVHRGGLVRTRWSNLVCFAGLGPGEVSGGGRKLVGLSQRRTRRWTRIQTTAFTSSEPQALVDLLELEPAERAEVLTALETGSGPVDASTEALRAALIAALPA